MNKDKLVLKDNTEIELESTQGIEFVDVRLGNKSEVGTLWEKFTKENLQQIALKSADGEITGTYKEMVLDHMLCKETEGNLQITLNLRTKTKEEFLEERIAVLETGQTTQDYAIGDLGQVVSDVLGGGV